MPACAGKPPLGFPYALAQDCKETPVKLEINGDIVLGYRSVRNDLKVCSAEKAAIRKWAKDSKLVPSDTP
ncbi:Rz1 protein [Sphingomonas phage Scott]|uniref:Rz1 protein n=1 Tax=Sphingomonas phage Scott TaxID=2282912 RepID=A0A346FDB0_9CAUD|nr:Rz1 protein [Sphingomonas phage Scott]AXN53724.1 Rz1 protein [Sphingomonas phage Scott]